MIWSAADYVGGPLEIRKQHMIRGIQLTDFIWGYMLDVMEKVFATPETEARKEVEKIIKKSGTVKHTPLFRHMSRKAVTGPRLRMLLQDLIDQGKIKRGAPTEKGGQTYDWVG
jgi:hypothetical protein